MTRPFFSMVLAKATNINTGAQSEAFIICGACYGKVDDAFAYANAVTNQEIALCGVSEDVAGVCEQCGVSSGCKFCDAPMVECFDANGDQEFLDCSGGCKASAGDYTP